MFSAPLSSQNHLFRLNWFLFSFACFDSEKKYFSNQELILNVFKVYHNDNIIRKIMFGDNRAIFLT